MAVRFYLRNVAAPYSPATFRGGWDSTGSAVTKLIDSEKASDTKWYTQFSQTGTAPYSHLHYRGVTGKLKAGTIGTGTVNLCVSFREDNAGVDAYWRVHIYVTQGDSDTVRGTLLNQYAENTTNELPVSTNTASSLQSAQALSSVTVSDNDRIVVEIGLVKRGATTSNAVMVYGVGTSPAGSTDAAVGDEAWTANRVAWIEFSEALGFMAAARVTQERVEAAFEEVTAAAAVTQGRVEATFSEATAAAAVTQSRVEVVLLDDANPARVSQAVAETLQAQTTTVRVSQTVAELLTPSVAESRVSQAVVELLLPVIVETRLSQAIVEALNAGVDDVRVSQFVVEVLGKMTTYCGTPSLSPAPLCGKPDVLAWLEWTVPMRSS